MVEYGLFSDESGGPGERFRSLAAVSGPLDGLRELQHDLDGHARDHGIRDLKWAAVRTRKQRLEAARAYLATATQAAAERRARLDVLVWKDDAELKSMYVKLLSRAARGWESSVWSFYPDQRTGINWNGIIKAANRSMTRKKFLRTEPQRSSENSLVQLADLMAGMSRFCRERSVAFQRWLKLGHARGALPATQNRFQIARDFYLSYLESDFSETNVSITWEDAWPRKRGV